MNLNLTREQWAEVTWDNWSSGYHARKALEDIATLFAENERFNLRIAELEAR